IKAQANDLEETDYSVESWAKLEEALALPEDKQSEVNAKVEAIQEAIDALTQDRTALEAIKAEVEKLNKTDYSVASWAELEKALDMPEDVQSQIDTKVTEIEKAMKALGQDKTALEEIMKEVADLKETDYSVASWTELEKALALPEDVQSQIDTKVAEIRKAIDALTQDRTALEAIKAEVAKLNETDYSVASWAELEKALDMPEDVQSEIDTKVTEIEKAMKALGQDKTALNEILSEVVKLEETDYSVASWTKLKEALAMAEGKQSEIDAKVEAIKEAMAGLTVDKTALEAIVEKANDLEEEDYSAESWKVLQEALKLPEDKQSEVNAKVEAIANAIKALGQNREALDAILAEVAKLNSADYSTASWAELQNALKLSEDTQADIDAKVEAIKVAMANLTVDKTELKAMLEKAKDLEETDYSEASWAELEKALALPEDKQSEINAKVEAIQEAINGLTVDKTALNAILAEVAKLTASDYSEASWKTLQTAIAGAEDLSKQSEIDSKVEEIQTAMNGLTVDKSQLTAILLEVAQLIEKDYSIESWTALMNATAGVEELTKQSEIDAKVVEIRTAIDHLTVDKTALNAILAEVAKLTASDYSEASWRALQTAIAGAEDLSKQSEIDAKVVEIRTAIDGLTADKTQLTEILARVAGLTQADYTTASWTALMNATAGAEELKKQSEIDAKVNEIQLAINALVIRDLTANDFVVTNTTAVYSGTEKNANVTTNLDGVGTISVVYKQGGSVVTPISVGQYDIYVNVEAGTKFGEVKDLKVGTLTINKAEQPRPNISLSNDQVILTGNAPTLTISNSAMEGATVTYTSSNTNVATIDNNGNIKLEGLGETTITVTFGETANYNENSATITLKVIPDTLTADSFEVSNNTVTYNGQPQTATVTTNLTGVGEMTVRYEQNGNIVTPINAGVYDIIVNVTKGTNYEAVSNLKVGTLTINKATYVLENVKFENAIVDYDGNVHQILATGVPTGISVRYENNVGTNVGVYKATATFELSQELSKNYNAISPARMEAELAIQEIRRISVENAPQQAKYDTPLDCSQAMLAITKFDGERERTERIPLTTAGITISGYNGKRLEEEQTITVEYKGFTTTFNVIVHDYIIGIVATHDGVVSGTVSYNYGQNIDATKIRVVTINASGRPGTEVTNLTNINSVVPSTATIDPQKGIKLGANVITLTYEGHTANITINILAPSIYYNADGGNIQHILSEQEITVYRNVKIFATPGVAVKIQKDGTFYTTLTTGEVELTQEGTYTLTIEDGNNIVVTKQITIEKPKPVYQFIDVNDNMSMDKTNVKGIYFGDIDNVTSIVITTSEGEDLPISIAEIKANGGKYFFTESGTYKMVIQTVSGEKKTERNINVNI
ncbi:MAG: hypothetical protein HFJ33_07810, partial [Clostridia bacterium]|nr:hypothetical protein [Clostridia bacterium]